MRGKKRITWLTVLALLIGTLGGAMGNGDTASAVTGTERVTAHVHDMSENCGNEQALTFTEWSNPDAMPDTPGNYYLTTDVTIPEGQYKRWIVPKGTTNLCLNGHTIYKDYTYVNGMISVGEGVTLNICDCGEGKIYHKGGCEVLKVWNGGNVNLYGVTLLVGGDDGIQIEEGGCASLYDGSIIADENSLAPAYYGVLTDDEGSTFTMNGGTICNMRTGVKSRNGAVFTMNGGSITGSDETGIQVDGGIVKLSGNIRVSESGEQDILLQPDYDSMDYEIDESDPDNPKVFIKDIAYYKLFLTGPLSEEADLGKICFYDINDLGYEEYYPPIVTAVEGDGYTVTDEDLKKVSTDNDMYYLKREGNSIQMVLKTFDVTFDSNGGETVDKQVIMYGKTVEEPAVPKRTGYTFSGWYQNKECTEEWDFDNAVVTKDITLYAGWAADKYTVTYDYQGATGGTNIAQKEVTYGSAYGALPVPEKTNYVFDGWYTESSGGSEVTETTPVTTASDHTLYARWSLECSHVWEQKSDNENHWQQCSLCEKKKEIHPHTEDAGTVVKEPTETEDGIRNYACSECGTVMRTETIPKTGGEVPGEETEPPAPTQEPDEPVKTPETPPVQTPAQTPGQTSVPTSGQPVSVPEPVAEVVQPTQQPAILPGDLPGKVNDTGSQEKNFRKLMAMSKKQTKRSVTLKWKRVKGADGYKIYGSRCGKKQKYELLKTVKGRKTSYTCKKIGKEKLKKGCFYKYTVVAYKMINGKQVPVVSGTTVYTTTSGGKYGVARSVKVKKAKVSLKKGKSFKIKAKEVKADKKIKRYRRLAYESSNQKVASVSKKGVIKAKGRGSCKIYVYAQNGIYKAVKVRVR